MVVSSVSPLRWLMIAAQPARVRHGDGVQRLGQRADLVELDEDGVGGALADALGQALRVRDEEVVAHELHVAAELGVSFHQPVQSSSASPSSMLTMGYLAHQPCQCATISSLLRERPSLARRYCFESTS